MSRQEKIRRSADFEAIKSLNHKSTSRHFIVLDKPNPLNVPRLGIIVSRKVGNAVKRNKIKRLIRAFFRQNKHSMKPADYVIIGKSAIRDIAYDQAEQELSRITCIK